MLEDQSIYLAFVRWDEPQLRIFNITSKIHQAVELVIGLLWAIVSFATVWFVKGYLRKSLKVE
jgi:hypothetical protein